MKYFLVMMLVGFAAFGLGCSGAPDFAQVRMTGTVTIDAIPVELGTINFVPRDSDQGPSTSADIVAGKYEADVGLGSVRVYFQATRETGRMIKMYDQPDPERVNLIPAHYRRGVEIDVQPQDKTRNFELSSSRGKSKHE